MTIQFGEVSVEQAFSMVTKAYPFRNMTLEDLSSVLELIDSNYLLFFDKEKMRENRNH